MKSAGLIYLTKQCYKEIMETRTIIRTVERTALCRRTFYRHLTARLAKDRWLFNHFLEKINQHYEETGESLSFFDCCNKLKELRETDAELAKYNVTSQRYVLKRLCDTFKAFYKKEGGKPRFKGINRKIRSFQTDSFSIRGNKIKIKGLPSIKVRSIPGGEIKLVRVLQTALRVVVQFVTAIEKEVVVSDAPAVGIDVGVKSLAVLSDGTSIESRSRDHSKIKELQHDLHLQTRAGKSGEHNKPKTKGSRAYNATRRKLAKEHERVRIKERNDLHMISREVVTLYPNIVLEDLTIPNLVKNRRLSRRILEQGWGILKRMLTYKSEETGGKVVLVSPRNTSKTCSGCGSVKDTLSLRERVYKCSECGIEIDRDLNAAINISRRGLSRRSGGDLAEGFGNVVARGSDLNGSVTAMRGSTFRAQKDILAV